VTADEQTPRAGDSGDEIRRPAAADPGSGRMARPRGGPVGKQARSGGSSALWCFAGRPSRSARLADMAIAHFKASASVSDLR